MNKQNLLNGLNNWSAEVADIRNLKTDRLLDMLGGLSVLEYSAMSTGENELMYMIQSAKGIARDEIQRRMQ